VHWAPGIPCALCYQRRERFLQNLGRVVPRERGVVSSRLFENRIHLVVPDKRANGSRERAPDDRLRERDPGPITTNVHC
jgi:hypothetical protein